MGKFDWDVDIIAASGLFDCAWYLTEYPDVKALGAKPIEHYLLIGAELLRDPSTKFSTKKYIDRRPDLQASGVNPLVHFITSNVPYSRDEKDCADASAAAADAPLTTRVALGRSGSNRGLLGPELAEALRDPRLFDVRFYGRSTASPLGRTVSSIFCQILRGSPARISIPAGTCRHIRTQPVRA